MIVVKRGHEAGTLNLETIKKSEVSDWRFGQLMQAFIHTEGDMYVLILLDNVLDHADHGFYLF
jgi:hypothetical protein